MAIDFHILPPEMWSRIIEHADPFTCSKMSLVCKTLDALVKAPALLPNWEAKVFKVIRPGAGFHLLLDFVLDGKKDWRSLFLGYALATREPKLTIDEKAGERTSVLKLAHGIIYPIIQLEAHLDLDIEESIEEQVAAMREAQRRVHPIETYESLFIQLQMQNEAQGDDPEICYYLSECYFRGIGVRVDPVKAFEFAQMAARKGHEVARLNLGAFFAQGFGVEQNEEEAIRLLSGLSNPRALFWLAQFQLKRADEALAAGLPLQNLAIQFHEAFQRMEQAAVIGQHPEAQYLTGLYYLNGYGDEEEPNRPIITQIDLVKAFRFFNASAHQGHMRALYRLGDCHLRGLGTIKSFAKGLSCWKLASRFGESSYCSEETFLSLESENERRQMWQFLREGAKRHDQNAIMAMWSIKKATQARDFIAEEKS